MLLKYQLPGTNDMEELVSLENNEDLDNFKVSHFVKQDSLRRAIQAGQLQTHPETSKHQDFSRDFWVIVCSAGFCAAVCAGDTTEPTWSTVEAC